jgi:hypothetical protein
MTLKAVNQENAATRSVSALGKGKDQRTDSTMGEVPLAISVKPSSNTVIRERSAVAILGACPEVLTMLVLD